MFLGCPHRCRTIPALQQGLERLVQGLPSIAMVPVSLTTSLANLIITISDEFLNANIHLDISIANMVSLHDDDKLRVCSTISSLPRNTPNVMMANRHRCLTLTKQVSLLGVMEMTTGTLNLEVLCLTSHCSTATSFHRRDSFQHLLMAAPNETAVTLL